MVDGPLYPNWPATGPLHTYYICVE